MTRQQLIHEVERRIEAANRKPQGADMWVIARAVAEEDGRTYEDVRCILTDAWARTARTG